MVFRDSNYLRRAIQQSRRRLTRHIELVLIPLWFLAATPMYPIDPSQKIGQMMHSVWTGRDGFNGIIYGLAQTRDGYLWIATQSGLYRFDGIRFKLWGGAGNQLPSNRIAALVASPDGGLWVGFTQGGAAFIKDGRTVSYQPGQNGFPTFAVVQFAITNDGRVWVSGNGGFACFSKGQWSKVGPSQGYRGPNPETLFVDDTGRLWEATNKGGTEISTLENGASSFEATGSKAERTSQFAESPDGRIWAFDLVADRYVQLRGPTPLRNGQSFRRSDGGQKVLFDRDGSLWITSGAGGVRRIPYPGAIPVSGQLSANDSNIEEFLSKTDSLDAYRNAVLEDIEGNIWVGGRRGLETFRYRNFNEISMPNGSGIKTFFRGDGGDVWAAIAASPETDDLPIIRVQDRMLLSGAPGSVYTSYSDRDGSYWLSQRDHFWRYDHGRLQSVDLPDGIREGFVRRARRDAAGHLWIALRDHGLYRRDGDVWVKERLLPNQPDLAPDDLYPGPDGNLWVMYTNTVVVLRNGAVQTLVDQPGRTVAPFNVVTGGHERVWIGGEHGLATIVGNAIVPVLDEEGRSFSNVSSVVDSAKSGLWLVERARVLHIAASELVDLEKRGFRVHCDVFDEASDLPSPAERGLEGGDGLMWFSSSNGIMSVDPSRIYRNLLPPIVHIEGVKADGLTMDPEGIVTVPPGKRDIRITFSAISLSAPERVRVKYKLSPWDKDWQEADERKEADYTNLPPGSYEFHVTAANNDNVWNDKGASTQIQISPTFYETWWFRIICFIAFALGVWGVYLYRVASMMRTAQERMTTRLDERERIAREFHDSLLQGFQGTLLHLQLAVDQLHVEGARRSTFESALERAEQVIVEARDKMKNLRRGAVATFTLADSLAENWLKLAELQRCELATYVSGTVRLLKPEIEDEIRSISSEAVSNALRYARASQVSIFLDFGPREFSLRVADDGIGIDREILDGKVTSGHWGLINMRERSERLKGKFEVLSDPSRGTTISVMLPAATTYLEPSARSPFLAFWQDLF